MLVLKGENTHEAMKVIVYISVYLFMPGRLPQK